ncbi:DUF423 domain-containing protein [Olivibacter domesticus]|jgi:uncharacterized membrane protein YgdD (TMEM256/DUF423 family)|uniref:Uncharacterized membrane protein YgdD, TMEM256/DUF423 family n=1 Tax=Olivibacter domesticus TaxID=407022 RepID=A0A1H7YC40_OLID1|nr:DUF423 domain-containing protein [Olivibacter domesticus]SEM42729.1 Uncharacterized membrane protein YgdD, TMEM256/DUF423 family [Olivibacter domesticus]
MNKRIILTAATFGLIAVVLGAFGAHGLTGKISEQQLENWHTAVNYQFYHTLALLFLATFSRAKNTLIIVAYLAFTLGILLFSGSLYLLSTRELTGITNIHILGPITPLGGLSLILGWASLFLATLKGR